MNKTTKPMTEQILDWFEHNPGAKMRSGPLAKALKADATKTAEALGRLANGGQLDRVRVIVPANERGRAAAEQWEYWLPLGGKVVPAPKPYQPPKAFRRDAPAPTISTEAVQPAAVEVQADTPPAADPSPALQFLRAELATARQELADSRAETDQVKVDMAQKLADSEARVVELEAALAEANSRTIATTESFTPAGYVVATPKKPLRRAKAEKTALQLAMSAARTNGIAEVYAIFPAGKAVRGAEWRPASWPAQ